MAKATVNELVEAFGKAFSDREKDLSIRIFEPYHWSDINCKRESSQIQTQKDELEKKDKEIDVTENSKIAELEKELNNLKNAHENERKQIEPLSNIHSSVIHARFTNIAKMISSSTSAWTTIDGRKWAIRIEKGKEFLDAYLEMEFDYYNRSKTVSVQCHVYLISHNSSKIVHKCEVNGFYLINYEKKSQGYRLISINDLFDEGKGYVKDDSINIAIEFTAFPTN